MKRTLIYLILASMILHCCARLGFVSYVYENRYVIAFQLGLVREIPIAICSNDYDFDQGLHIQVANESDKSLPVSFPNAREINLFMESDDTHKSPHYSLLCEYQVPWVIEKNYPVPDILIFHPPA